MKPFCSTITKIANIIKCFNYVLVYEIIKIDVELANIMDNCKF